jgi:hypothetical protein
MHQPTDLVERYVAVWNEPDAEARRAAIEHLWADDGAHILQPPQEIRDTAASIGFVSPTLEARGHAELEIRVTRAHEEFVAPGEYVFRGRGDAVQLGDAVRFGWEMVPVGQQQPAAVGMEFLVLDARGRIRLDYQFIEQ